ncbi:hypothetical protein ABZ319_15115 [Nocardia sp. NPDC005978]|uniref:hypothetical protein n=1 Tax=Nocardia sp. NPDC005978 TaxID=3156725 RepID=UPI0033A72F06
MTTINEVRVMAALHVCAAPLSLRDLETETGASIRVTRKTLAALMRSGLIEQATAPEPRWQLSARGRRWVDTAVGRAALDVPEPSAALCG